MRTVPYPFLNFLLFENEPQEYVGENENGRSHKENEKTGGALIPNVLPVYILGLFLYKARALIPHVLYEISNLAPHVLYERNNLVPYVFDAVHLKITFLVRGSMNIASRYQQYFNIIFPLSQ